MDPHFAPAFLIACTIWMLISASGTRFPRAVGEPPRRLAPAGSPLDALFPQESRPFRSNQLCFEILGKPFLSTVYWNLYKER
ncbi:Uncharacterised protein [Chlamydia trachomatis]|nr:Uncharacterised protein [Chlamydia trachomatis]